MVQKRGLGRGLGALIPGAEPTQTTAQEISLHNPTAINAIVEVFVVDDAGRQWTLFKDTTGVLTAHPYPNETAFTITIPARQRCNIKLNDVQISGSGETLNNRNLSIITATELSSPGDGVTVSRIASWETENFNFEMLASKYVKMADISTQELAQQWYFPMISVQKYITDQSGRPRYHGVQTRIVVLNPNDAAS